MTDRKVGRPRTNNPYTQRLSIPLTVEQKRMIEQYLDQIDYPYGMAPWVRDYIIGAIKPLLRTADEET